MRPALAGLAGLFLAAHLLYLPPTLEDIDSVNFALGVRDYDVARHQPHPPGYPVYVVLAKGTAAVLGALGSERAVVLSLSLWSALSGAALVPLLFLLFRQLDGSDDAARRAWWAMAIAVASPLFWFTALRPLSDMTGLAIAVAAQYAMLAANRDVRERRAAGLLFLGGVLAGLAAGVRVQTAMLTAPLLATLVILLRTQVSARARLGAVLAAVAGTLLWFAPLLVVSGGLDGYLAALGTQAGEDFHGVVMLWTTRSPRVAVDAFAFTFLWPWGGLVAGAIVLAVAVAGASRLLSRNPSAVFWLVVGYAPYAAFHLLFHETITVRYALPLVVPIAYLASAALEWAGRRGFTVLSTAAVILLLSVALPAARAYGSNAAPAFQAVADQRSANQASAVAMHAVYRRTAEWQPPAGDLLRATHGREWLTMVERWKAKPDESIDFLADPTRTDLALFDRHARELKRAYRWTFAVLPFVGGVRPGSTDLWTMAPPGWMLDRGWALSAELGGVAARDRAGPHLAPSVAWLRSRTDPALLMIGGRNLDPSRETELTLQMDGRQISAWSLRPGFFFRVVPLSGGSLAGGSRYIPLSVQARSPGAAVPVSLEQFDLQSEGVPMWGYAEGWQEPEYNPATARSWRWITERGVIWVRPAGRDVTLTLGGESPLRYFDSPPVVRVSVGGQEVGRFSPAADFEQRLALPDARLRAAGGQVVVESNLWFTPADRQESADRRHLALRIYNVDVK